MTDMIKLIKLVRSIDENLPLLTYPTVENTYFYGHNSSEGDH